MYICVIYVYIYRYFQAIKTGEVLARTAKGFLYKRVCKDIIPKATNMLIKQVDVR